MGTYHLATTGENAGGASMSHAQTTSKPGLVAPISPDAGFEAKGIAVKRFWPRTIARSGSWTAGLLLAAWTVPHVSLSSAGVVIALAFFTFTQTLLSAWILKLPHAYASLVLGSTGLALTIVALGLGSSLSSGFRLCGTTSWLATTTVVWLTTTIGAILSFDMYQSRESTSS